MSKRKGYEIIGTGEKCPKCGDVMQRREHKEIRQKQRNAPYYFKEWDYCWQCKHLQHYEWAKVMNNNASARMYQRKMNAYEERQQQLRFLKSI